MKRCGPLCRVFGSGCWLIVGVLDVLPSEATCLFLAPSGLLVSDVMAIIVEGELRSPRRDLFCVHVGVESSCALLITLAFFVDPFYLMLRAHNGCPTPVATDFQRTPDHQSPSIAVWSHLSVVRTHVHGLPHFSTTPATSSIRHLSGVMMASKRVQMSLFFSSFPVSASYPIILQSSSPWTHPSRGSPLTSSPALCQNVCGFPSPSHPSAVSAVC